MPSNAIAVMNTKGGVGKSTLVLALAETLSAYHGKNVLVIDSDAQASVSSMLTSVANLHRLQSEGLTIVDYLVARVLQNGLPDWSRVVIRDVGDVDDARSIFLIPSDMQLTLFEREVSREGMHGRLRAAIAKLLEDVKSVFDIVLIDCPPGLSVLTECWLREADYHISPTKADYVSVCGLEVFRRFKALNPEMGFADNLGVIVNMKDPNSATEEEYHRWLLADPSNNCLRAVIPRTHVLQDAARFHTMDRSYFAKYPGYIGAAIRSMTEEVLARLSGAAATQELPLPAQVASGVAVESIPLSMPASTSTANPAAPEAVDVGTYHSDSDSRPAAAPMAIDSAFPDASHAPVEIAGASVESAADLEPAIDAPVSPELIETIADAARGIAGAQPDGDERHSPDGETAVVEGAPSLPTDPIKDTAAGRAAAAAVVPYGLDPRPESSGNIV